MVIILDAYNILKQISTHRDVSPHEISRFIRTMSKRCHDRGYHAIAVFDGGTSRHVTRSTEGMLTIIYAGYHKSADDVIIDIIPAYCLRDECILISADRKLRTQAELLGALSITPEPLIAILHAPHEDYSEEDARSKPLQRMNSAPKTAIDLLMEEAAATMTHPVKQESNNQQPRQRTGAKLSKSEKEYERIVSKL